MAQYLSFYKLEKEIWIEHLGAEEVLLRLTLNRFRRESNSIAHSLAKLSLDLNHDLCCNISFLP